jgi:hypothetical protein
MLSNQLQSEDIMGAPKQNASKSEVMTVISIASHFFLSTTMPTIPNTNDSGVHPSTSNTPSVANRLPHPGCRIIINRITPAETANKLAAIFPKRINPKYHSGQEKSSVYYCK